MKARISIAVLAVILLSSVSLFAQSSKDDIKKRMKERYPVITDLKEKGKIGETHLGYVEMIDAKNEKDEALQTIVSDENADRELLYKIIAEQTETKPDQVGKQNALRIFQKAEDDEYFKAADDVWRQKKDMKVEKKKTEDE
jgi:uncharacterized protein YdbL (DUF1318 family)